MKIEWDDAVLGDETDWNNLKSGEVFGVVYEEGGKIFPHIKLYNGDIVELISGTVRVEGLKFHRLMRLEATLKVRRIL